MCKNIRDTFSLDERYSCFHKHHPLKLERKSNENVINSENTVYKGVENEQNQTSKDKQRNETVGPTVA